MCNTCTMAADPMSGNKCYFFFPQKLLHTSWVTTSLEKRLVKPSQPLYHTKVAEICILPTHLPTCLSVCLSNNRSQYNVYWDCHSNVFNVTHTQRLTESLFLLWWLQCGRGPIQRSLPSFDRPHKFNVELGGVCCTTRSPASRIPRCWTTKVWLIKPLMNVNL
jgi:hypothetical protein